jgi:hypothetical protein
MKTKSIKTTLTVCVVATLAWLGASPSADARPPAYYGPSASYVYGNGHCSSNPPVYTERYFIGYDCYGRAIWGYRQVRSYYSPPVRPSYRTPTPYRHYSYHDSYRHHGRSYGGYCR